MKKPPDVYILASRRNGTLYTGVTSDLIKRIWEHKNNVLKGFTKKYNVHNLVWYELHETLEAAIKREKAIKEWIRNWKLQLIEKNNPSWKDLYSKIVQQNTVSCFRQSGMPKRRWYDDTAFVIPAKAGI